MSPPEKYGKRKQITFRIGPLMQDRLEQAAALFDMKPTEYVKALLYQHLGILTSPWTGGNVLTSERRGGSSKRKKKSKCCVRILSDD